MVSASIKLAELRCYYLSIIHDAGDPAWEIAKLLKMPILHTFKAVACTKTLDPQLFLHGTHELPLMRIEMDLRVPSTLRLEGPRVDREGCDVLLGRNGQLYICLDAECRPCRKKL